MKKKNEFRCLFVHNIIFNGLCQTIRNNIVAKKTTELVLLFHKNITKLVFIWPNMGQKSFKVLTYLYILHIMTVNYLFVFIYNCKVLIFFFINVPPGNERFRRERQRRAYQQGSTNSVSMIDKMSRILFPASYSLLNLWYWYSYYDTALELSWSQAGFHPV